MTNHAGPESNPAVSPNGRYSLHIRADTVSYNRADLRVKDLRTGEVVR